MPIKIIKEYINIVTDFDFNNFNNTLMSSHFLSNLKKAGITPFLKKKFVKMLKNIALLASLLFYQKSVKGVCKTKCMNT